LAPDRLWDTADFDIGMMTLINLLVLFLARREIKEETEIYFGYCRRQER
jgi:Na+/alanine symporter